jgi:signal transduction histidine kinase
MSVDPDRLAVALSNIRTSSTQMAGLIDQLLDYARMRMDRPLELSRRPTDLVDLARRSVESYAAVSDRHKLRFDSPPQPIVGEWDQPRLERVVQNLIGNAVKYSPDGGEIVVRAATSTEGNNLWAVLTVRDQGLGIPSEDVPLIFDRFHRAANVQQIAGTGLGLSAARQVVQQHGGSIDIASTEGAGTTVTVRLPLGGPDELPSGPDEPLVDQRTTSVKPTGELRVALQGGLN